MTETIEFICRLEEERGRLERLKKSISSPESMAAKPILSTCTNRSSSVNVTTAGVGVAFFGIQLAFRRRLVANVFSVFENHRAEILAANVSVDEQRQQLTLTITAMVGGYRGDETIEKIKREILVI